MFFKIGVLKNFAKFTGKHLCQTVCYYHVTCEFQSESTFYNLPECQGTPCLKQMS